MVFLLLQLITFQHIDSNGPINDIQTISNNIVSDKSTIENINSTLNSDQIQEMYSDRNKFKIIFYFLFFGNIVIYQSMTL